MKFIDFDILKENSTVVVGVVSPKELTKRQIDKLVSNESNNIIKSKYTSHELEVMLNINNHDVIIKSVPSSEACRGHKLNYLFVSKYLFDSAEFYHVYKTHLSRCVVNYNVKKEYVELDNQPRVFLF